MTTPPRELALLRERMAQLSDLEAVGGLLFWDQQTMMPPGGATARADQAATLARAIHDRRADPELGVLLRALEPWAAGEDPDSDAARLVSWARRDFEKAIRLPPDLAAQLTHAQALGQQAWLQARAANDFGRFRDALARHVELRHRYVDCYEGHEHPYDVLLDDFEPGLTTAQLRPLFSELRDRLVPLVAAAGAGEDGDDGPFRGAWSAEQQRVAALDLLEAVGFDPDGWRLDPAMHPFAIGIGPGDVRLTTRYDEHDFAPALFSSLHEFGHGLYQAAVDPALRRTTLDDPASLGVHESQSRLWENFVGRSRAFCTWLLPRLREQLPGLRPADPGELYRAVNAVQPSLVRTDADETTYNLHVVLRFELELGLIEGSLAVDDVPAAWDAGMERLLGVQVPSAVDGVLQDVHWSAGLVGYFPTYTVGNLMAAQLWERLASDLGDVDAQLERGDFAPLRAWLREHVHRHGRKFRPRELLHRVTGEDLRVEPFLTYLQAKLEDAGVLGAAR